MLPKIVPPFFELGPKNYMYGERVVELAQIADETAKKYSINVIFSAPFINAKEIIQKVKNSFVFVPYMDDVNIGPGVGKILPESLKAIGVNGVCLNHSEKPITLSTLCSLINRAKEIGLYTDVVASSMMEIRAVATLNPDIIIAEPVDLIGGGETADLNYINESISIIKTINPDIRVLIGAGITNGDDVYKVIYAGGDATGSASGIFKSQNPEKIIDEMFRAMRQAWNDRHKINY